MGGCCAPNRWKPTQSLYHDDGGTFAETGDKIVGIADAPLVQTIEVQGSYMRRFVDDYAMVCGLKRYREIFSTHHHQNLTLIVSVQMADKQAVFYGISFDRAVVVTYQFLDQGHHWIGNYSTGILRNTRYVPDVRLPRHTRYIVRFLSFFLLHAWCTSHLHAGSLPIANRGLWFESQSHLYFLSVCRSLRRSESSHSDQNMLYM